MADERYIARQELVDALFSDEHMDDKVFSANDICRIADTIPAADVRPVVPGRWIDDMDDLGEYHICSICGRSFANGPLVALNFCPNCGADMREEAGT